MAVRPPEPTGPTDTTQTVAQALRAVARRRAMGLHFVGHYVGIDGAAERGHDRTRLVLPPREPGERVTDAALGVLVDLAMGQAVRASLSHGMRLATSSLVMHVAPGPLERPVEATAHVEWLEDGADGAGGTAAVRFRVTGVDGRPAATGSGSFVTIPSESGHNVDVVDWDRGDSVPDVTPDDLTADEAAMVAAVVPIATDAETSGGLLDVTWTQVRGDAVTGELQVGSQHDNRVGNLQGGLVYGIGAAAARRLFAGRRRIVDGQVLYLRPVGHGPLTITATVLRRGRRMAFVRVVLEAGGKQSAELTYTLGADGSA
jgi:acyl-coenzyme A thioesterase PaaI-like protein